MKIKVVLCLGLLFGGCATTNQPEYFYNEIRVLNQSRDLIRDVSITVAETGRVFGCGNIAPRGICSNRFGKRIYEMNPIQISWVFGNTQRQTRAFVVPVPEQFATNVTLRGVLAIRTDGSIATYFEQDRSDGQ